MDIDGNYVGGGVCQDCQVQYCSTHMYNWIHIMLINCLYNLPIILQIHYRYSSQYSYCTKFSSVKIRLSLVTLRFLYFLFLSFVQDNTQGINCEKCKSYFFRPEGKSQGDKNACKGNGRPKDTKVSFTAWGMSSYTSGVDFSECNCSIAGTKNVTLPGVLYLDCLRDDNTTAPRPGMVCTLITRNQCVSLDSRQTYLQTCKDVLAYLF